MPEVKTFAEVQPAPWTNAREEHFLEVVAKSGSISAACRTTGLKRSTVYWRKENDEAFAERLAFAIRCSVARLEHAAIKRGVGGWLEPVFYEGVVCGHKRKYSNTLLLRLLEAHAPEKYRREVVAASPITINVVTVLQDANERARAVAQSFRAEPVAAIADGSEASS